MCFLYVCRSSDSYILFSGAFNERKNFRFLECDFEKEFQISNQTEAKKKNYTKARVGDGVESEMDEAKKCYFLFLFHFFSLSLSLTLTTHNHSSLRHTPTENGGCVCSLLIEHA